MRQRWIRWVFLGSIALSGCGPIRATYQESRYNRLQPPQKWAYQDAVLGGEPWDMAVGTTLEKGANYGLWRVPDTAFQFLFAGGAHPGGAQGWSLSVGLRRELPESLKVSWLYDGVTHRKRVAVRANLPPKRATTQRYLVKLIIHAGDSVSVEPEVREREDCSQYDSGSSHAYLSAGPCSFKGLW